MARVTWSTFDRLTAAQVQTVSDQGVMRFATTTARDAALGVGVREVGMMSAVAAAPDNGAPRYWDGSSWELVSAGVDTPVPLVAGDAANADDLPVNVGSMTGGTWYELSAGLGSAVVITNLYVAWSSGARTLDLGTGASGAEVVRASQEMSTGGTFAIPYGVYVPASTRIAVRLDAGVTLAVVRLHYHTVASGVLRQAGSSTATTSGTSWVQVAASPPLAGGVHIVGIRGPSSAGLQLGFGAAASEVTQTGYLGTSGRGAFIPPLVWPAGTRLAVRQDAAGTAQVAIYWREALDV